MYQIVKSPRVGSSRIRRRGLHFLLIKAVKYSVDYLNIVTYILGYGATSVLLFWLARTLFIYYRNIRRVEAIHKYEAKTAVLRMLLRAKLKKHGKSIQYQFRSDKVFLDLVRPKIEEICGCEFSSPHEYEKVMNSLISLYDIIDVELVKRSPTLFKKNELESKSTDEDKKEHWFKLAKYGKAHAILIREMVEATAELKNMIDRYNSEQDGQFKNRFKSPEPILIAEFDSLAIALASMDQADSIEFEERKIA